MKPWAMYSYVQSISKVKKGKVINLEVLAKSVLGDKVEHMMTQIFIFYLYFAKLVGFTQQLVLLSRFTKYPLCILNAVNFVF